MRLQWYAPTTLISRPIKVYMTDHGGSDETWAEMRQSDITEALEQADAKSDCPSCGANSWSLIGGEGQNAVRIPLFTAGRRYEAGGPHIPAFALVCEQCGFLRLHSAKVLSEELNSKNGSGNDVSDE